MHYGMIYRTILGVGKTLTFQARPFLSQSRRKAFILSKDFDYLLHIDDHSLKSVCRIDWVSVPSVRNKVGRFCLIESGNEWITRTLSSLSGPQKHTYTKSPAGNTSAFTGFCRLALLGSKPRWTLRPKFSVFLYAKALKFRRLLSTLNECRKGIALIIELTHNYRFFLSRALSLSDKLHLQFIWLWSGGWLSEVHSCTWHVAANFTAADSASACAAKESYSVSTVWSKMKSA